MPAIDSIGDSADGLTYIVTGPTRLGSVCFLHVVAHAWKLIETASCVAMTDLFAWSNDWLPAYSDIVGLAVASVQRQRLLCCVAKHMVRDL